MNEKKVLYIVLMAFITLFVLTRMIVHYKEHKEAYKMMSKKSKIQFISMDVFLVLFLIGGWAIVIFII